MTFASRHIGPTNSEIEYMLQTLGYKSLEEFVSAVVPQSIAIKSKLVDSLPKALSESEAIAALRERANKNKVYRSAIGMGYYGTITPAVVLRNVLENPAWYTAYTPYQPEISQGRLEALFAFQTAVTDLTGLDIANASMLDESTAAAEAMTLAHRSYKGSDDAVFLVDKNVHPQTLAVMQTRANPLGLNIQTFDVTKFSEVTGEVFGVLVQYPNTFGAVIDHHDLAKWAHEKNAVVVAAADLLALTMIKAPAEWGADVAVGSTQRFGVPMGFGGPHAGYMAVRNGLERSMPGRLVGQSIDVHGAPAFRLALQTREQHIRREKATSNICTAQVLLAVMAAFYTMWHGPKGLKEIAERVHSIAARWAASVPNSNKAFFDTVTFDGNAAQVKAAADLGINVRVVDANRVSVSFDELSDEALLNDLAKAFGVTLAEKGESSIPSSLLRTSSYLTNPVFNTYHNETAMMRYMRTLADRDLALDRTMIPLGSCTMKLNAATEMESVTWPEFGALHPFAPADQNAGSRQLIKELSDWLVAITGYDAVSLQPNAGSQGEFAGLLAIRKYLDANGGAERNICLIPSSAHGTNAASAVMAGMKVVVVACDETGNVSVEDIKAKIAAHAGNLAALMVTYPSTHGVFEEAIGEICDLVHEAGGQVYVDGANLNALVGTAQPGKFGGDVSHLNLHKTFSIPHGGGGPGVGPVIARAHLAPYLPNHPLDPTCGPATGPGPISAAPFGSASILPISWSYIAMMGGDGLTRATQVAILSANYIAHILNKDFPILYTGANNLVAHECILDLRDITKETGVTVDDVAKRLMDFGFHAPTMSFPVPGTLMVEPTESEDLTEINRFIKAMQQIAAEIDEVRKGKVAVEESALRHAPHTSASLLTGDWNRSYSRESAAFPAGQSTQLMGKLGKYWPTVGRIDGAHGDRNLICTCPPVSDFE
ncbi:MAG: aminomethyl-transferring glycine dehydrogenase [Candidatus Nanopelagicaceae bacterium]